MIYFNRVVEDVETSESDVTHSPDIRSDESVSDSTDIISKKNVEKTEDHANQNEGNLFFKTGSNKELKRFLNVILFYNFNNCFIINIQIFRNSMFKNK